MYHICGTTRISTSSTTHESNIPYCRNGRPEPQDHQNSWSTIDIIQNAWASWSDTGDKKNNKLLIFSQYRSASSLSSEPSLTIDSGHSWFKRCYDSICDVVYQNDKWFNRCQFSFACIEYRIYLPIAEPTVSRAISRWPSREAKFFFLRSLRQRITMQTT